MRIHLNLTPNTETVPFEYQQNLVGAFHKWMGNNSLHDNISLYSLSWLRGGKARKTGLTFPRGAQWFISAVDTRVIKQLIRFIREDPYINWGMIVREIVIQEDPQFTTEEYFRICSPVFIKRTVNKSIKYYFYSDQESSQFLTETLQNKLNAAGINDKGVEVHFDTRYSSPRIKKINFNGIHCKASLCPVIIKGTPEQVACAWNVGVGNSTGIGFGSLL